MNKTGLTKGRVSQLFDDAQPFGEIAGRRLASGLGLDDAFFESDQATAHGLADSLLEAESQSPQMGGCKLQEMKQNPSLQVPLLSWGRLQELGMLGENIAPEDGCMVDVVVSVLLGPRTVALPIQHDLAELGLFRGGMVVLDPDAPAEDLAIVLARVANGVPEFRQYDQLDNNVYRLITKQTGSTEWKSDTHRITILAVAKQIANLPPNLRRK